MELAIKSFTIEDYEPVINLWHETDGIVLSDTDEMEPMKIFLHRNPGLSLVAYIENTLAGVILCSHDGRRGYLHHLAVKKEYRNQKIGSTLVKKCLKKISEEGIKKCNIFILDENDKGMKFWEKNGFKILPHYGWMQYSY